MIFDAALNWFIAEGIPITPVRRRTAQELLPDDAVSARDASGAVLASTDIVLPVSDEMDCRACHALGTGDAGAQPAAGWVYDADPQRDYPLEHPAAARRPAAWATPRYAAALAGTGLQRRRASMRPATRAAQADPVRELPRVRGAAGQRHAPASRR